MESKRISLSKRNYLKKRRTINVQNIESTGKWYLLHKSSGGEPKTVTEEASSSTKSDENVFAAI